MTQPRFKIVNTDVTEIRTGSVAAQRVSEGIEEGFTFGQYVMLVDCMSRTVREGKAFVSPEVESIFDRLQMDA
jgi:hypothetical protein